MNDATEPRHRPEPLPRPALAAMPPPAAPLPEDAGFADYLYGVARRGRWIAANMLVVAVAAAITSLFLPRWFVALGSFLPAVEERSGFSLTAFLREAAIPGAGLSDAVQAGDLSVALLKSNRVRDSLVAEFNLVRRYRVKDGEEAVRALDAHSGFFVGQEGLVSMTIEDRDPVVAAAMVNRAIDLLDRFNAEQRMTKGHRARLFIDGELVRAERDLRAAEDALEAYQTATKIVALSPQAESAVSAGANLMARKMEVEIELGMKQSVLREGNEELRRLRSELGEIDRKLGEFPALGLEAARLVRDLKVREQVYTYLRTEYEQARIQEERDTPSLTVVDRAEPPIKGDRPKRKLITLTAASVAGVVSVLGALVVAWIDFLPEDDRRRRALRAAGGELAALVRPGRRPNP